MFDSIIIKLAFIFAGKEKRVEDRVSPDNVNDIDIGFHSSAKVKV